MEYTYFPTQAVQYTDGIRSLSIIPTAGLVISDGTNNLTVNTLGFDNGTNTLLFQDIYTTVGKSESIQYSLSSSTQIAINNTILMTDTSTPTDIATFTNTSLNISTSAGVANDLTITSSAMTLLNTTTNQKIQLQNDETIYGVPAIVINNLTGGEVSYRFNELNCDSLRTYVFNNNDRFFKQMNPFSFKVYELLSGYDQIEKYMPFIFSQTLSLIYLWLPADYLDDNNDVGWSVVVSNYTNSTLDIQNGGIRWFSASGGGVNPPPIGIHPWAIVRITLVYSTIDAEYLWAVSQF